MTFVVNGREYELVRAGFADGMVLESWPVGTSDGPIAQVACTDSDGAMTFLLLRMWPLS